VLLFTGEASNMEGLDIEMPLTRFTTKPVTPNLRQSSPLRMQKEERREISPISRIPGRARLEETGEGRKNKVEGPRVEDEAGILRSNSLMTNSDPGKNVPADKSPERRNTKRDSKDFGYSPFMALSYS
jgi:hypothetical protein